MTASKKGHPFISSVSSSTTRPPSPPPFPFTLPYIFLFPSPPSIFVRPQFVPPHCQFLLHGLVEVARRFDVPWLIPAFFASQRPRSALDIVPASVWLPTKS
ncbi:hypothetical protein BDV32DRAFT_111278 [Aspergillus pseudonomiae]|nr:hypothetical protein BDV32DRAFT_111278 [Aspergillus pseudonomiae]